MSFFVSAELKYWFWEISMVWIASYRLQGFFQTQIFALFVASLKLNLKLIATDIDKNGPIEQKMCKNYFKRIFLREWIGGGEFVERRALI